MDHTTETRNPTYRDSWDCKLCATCRLLLARFRRISAAAHTRSNHVPQGTLIRNTAMMGCAIARDDKRLLEQFLALIVEPKVWILTASDSGLHLHQSHVILLANIVPPIQIILSYEMRAFAARKCGSVDLDYLFLLSRGKFH